MTRLEKKSSLAKPSVESTIQAAERVIELCHDLDYPNEEQQSLLACAHYTLAKQQDISLTRSKLHANSAITLLQNIRQRNMDLNSKLANAYFKRAEISEQECAFAQATFDYQRALEIFDSPFYLTQPASFTFSEENLLLIAQCAISIADILVNEQVDTEQLKHLHPLFYINKAIEYLAKLPKQDDEVWATLAYAHQIAGLALTQTNNVEDAFGAFRTALSLAFKTEPKIACGILGDIYNCIGLLFEQNYHLCPIQKVPSCFKENAMIYFGVALFFNPYEPTSSEDVGNLLDSVFDIVYRVLDPYLPPLSSPVMRDFIDALIFGYYCISDDMLPNQVLCQKLQQSDIANTYAQHIYWLVTEYHRREYTNARLLELNDEKNIDLSLDITDILTAMLSSIPNNVHYLNPVIPSLSSIAE